MSLAHTLSSILSSLRPNTPYIVAVICCLAVAFKLYSNAFSRSIFVSLTKRRLAEILQPPANRPITATPAAENQKTL
jgi:hypothetical protein